MNNDKYFGQFENVYCISLPRSTERRAHTRTEFDRVGLVDYEFIDARNQDSDEVAALYESDFVKKYPPCFRCGRNECDCDNKSLLRAQIGNWLSHMDAWKRVSGYSSGKLSLICEDDLRFQDNVYEALSFLKASPAARELLDSNRAVLVRLGWALCEDHAMSQKPCLTRKMRMANPCYAINPEMARRLLQSLERIDTTSDIYVHRVVGRKINHFTIFPPAAFELSWSTGEVVSEIRPKQKYIDHLKQQLEMLDPESKQRATLLQAIERERKRLAEFEQFNANPLHSKP